MCAFSSAALACTTQAPCPSPATDMPGTTADAITVTGSRIRLKAVAQLEPVTVTTRDYLDDRGQTNLADPARGNGFCAAIGRDASDQVLADPASPAVRTGFINGKGIRFSGVEAGLDYALIAGKDRPAQQHRP